MGNTNSNEKKHRDRPYSMDGTGNRCDSPRSSASSSAYGTGPDDSQPSSYTSAQTRFDFDTRYAPGKRRPVLCYQNSSDYGNEDTQEDFKNHVRSSQGIDLITDQKLPTVFKWDGGGKEVYITGTFSNWKPLKMVQSQGDFVTVVDIPEGVHKYKFVVDGTEKVDNSGVLDEEKVNNVLNVKKSDFEVFEALAMDLASNTTAQAASTTGNNNANNNNSTALSGSPPGSYSQVIPAHEQQHQAQSGPPILPPHLLQVILNNPSVSFGEPTLLPAPNHVMLNHLYALSIKDGVMVLSAIHRYRKKYVTTLLYKPI